jgi:hypothetical protein
MNAEDQGYTLYHLSRLEQKIADEGPDALTPGEKDFIAMAWNTFAQNKAAGTIPPGQVQRPIAPPPPAIKGAQGAAGALPPAAPGAAATAPPGEPTVDAETGMTYAQKLAMYREYRKSLFVTNYAEALRMSMKGEAPTPDEVSQLKKDIQEYIDERIGPTLWKNWPLLKNERLY